jgi:hypothetical protein
VVIDRPGVVALLDDREAGRELVLVEGGFKLLRVAAMGDAVA